MKHQNVNVELQLTKRTMKPRGGGVMYENHKTQSLDLLIKKLNIIFLIVRD